MACALTAGCASAPDADPRDPLEPMNRAITRFNDGFDQAIARPVATAYRDGVPDPVRGWVRNFFANIADVFIGFNNILQGKPDDGLQDWFRVGVNTVFGVFGINDVASDIGLEKHDEDFGQTLGRWGFGPGPYLVLPFLGPSSARDGVGTAADLYTDPVTNVKPNRLSNSAFVVRTVSKRADLLDASRLLEEAALDKYVFLRDAYLQRRRNQVYDGSPPRERDPDDPRDTGPDKRSDATPASNVYHPRIPRNYDALMANLRDAPNR
ncbi:MAG: VacJ family lipoprotein [Betaproteobacteria bacterium]|nr:VacJ family lipoprotein [Betaproteobacteria bacterium]